MTILCDRCRREIDAVGDIPIPPLASEITIERLPSIPVCEYLHLPNVGGVYFAYSHNRICYIGAAANFYLRWRHHRMLARLEAEADGRIAWIVVNDGGKRHRLEQESIKHFKPLWNVCGAERLSSVEMRRRFPSKADLSNRLRRERFRNLYQGGE